MTLLPGPPGAPLPDAGTYQVVANDQGQFSIWPAHSALPAGWHPAGPCGARGDCLAYIALEWVDILPRSAHPSFTPGKNGRRP